MQHRTAFFTGAPRRSGGPPGRGARALGALLLAASLLPAAARAQDEEMPAPTVRDIPEIAERLDSAEVDEVVAAIDLLTLVDDRRVVPHLARLLRSGREDRVTDRALLALRGLHHPSSLEVLTEFTNHRRVGARRRAYQAIAAIEDPRVPRLLERGLRDSDRSIRGTCARALGRIEAHQSVPALFLAFERGVVEAAEAIGKLGDASTVGRYSEHLGDAPLSVMLSGYRQYLSRRDIPDPTKIRIVQRLGEVSGIQIRRFLQRYLDTFATTFRAQRHPVRREVVATLRRIQAEADEARQGASEGTPPEGAEQ